jgi:hypothetical protein
MDGTTSKFFVDFNVPSDETLTKVWLKKLHTLKGQYGTSKGESEYIVQQCIDYSHWR